MLRLGAIWIFGEMLLQKAGTAKKEGSFPSSHKLKLFNSWGIDHTDLPNYIGHVEIIGINGVSDSQNLCHKGLFG